MDRLPIPAFVSAALERVTNAKSSIHKPPPNPLTYPKSALPYDSDVFKNPPSEYRGCPFWAWNTKLDKDELIRQIDAFADMGMGGFHMHSRTGLDTDYLGTEFLDMVSTCVEYAEKKGLLACLYDEDRWPSGTAGGQVIKDNPDFKKRNLRVTPNFYDGEHLIAAYIIDIDENGCLKSSRMLKETELHTTEGNIWFAYMETDGTRTWFNGETYVDTLNKDAMAHFIQLTHEKYKAKIGSKFGTTVPCIFTDEPEFTILNQLSDPRGRNDVYFAWTPDFLESYKKEYGSDLLPHIPELIWNLPEGNPSVARFRYHDHSCERFVSAFMDQLADWCAENNLLLNGHMMEEPTLHSQSCAIGEAMRCYRKMQMPGMDLLVDWTEYNTAKQVSSVARQRGLRGAMSELYGVTHWHFTFEGHKGQGDWMAALGITMRVHHLAWVSMRGEGKRDYPSSIAYQSPWYKEYGYVEGHFARVAVALTRGRAVTRVAVIHPIESYWLSFGPGGGDEMGARDQAFGDLTNWLLHGLLDFDFISESLLPSQVGRKVPKGKLAVGECEYDVVILPNLKTIRSTTMKILREFARAGGKIIVAGSAPGFVDASIPASNPIIEKTKNVLWSKQSILASLEEYRDLRITDDSGDIPNDKFLYQMREDGDDRFVFICNRDRNTAFSTTVQLKGHWEVVQLDSLTGNETKLKVWVGKHWTLFPYRFEGCASLLLRLSPSSADSIQSITPSQALAGDEVGAVSILKLEGVKLSEPNVFLLDYAEYKLDNGDWQPQEEILRLGNIVRGRLGIVGQGGDMKQPWCYSVKEREPKAQLTMRFTLKSDFTIIEPSKLALEDADTITIHINDVAIPSPTSTEISTGSWWVDHDIKTVPIPPYLIHKGTNTVTLSFPFGALTNVERIYLLGNFSVSLKGHDTLLQPALAHPITWGNIVPQGLPFYVGNVIYKCSFTVPPSTKKSSKTEVTLSVPHFSNPVLTVHDTKSEQKLGAIAFQPRTLKLGKFKEGEHTIEITAFGNRYNSFGHFHCPDWLNECGPYWWRTGGDYWTDDYSVKPIGILDTPVVFIGDSEEEDASDGEAPEERKDSGEWVQVSRLEL